MENIYSRYVEFISDKADTHPQTGEGKDKTIIDAYVFNDRVELWSWGTIDTLRPKQGTSMDTLVDKIRNFMESEGFAVVADETKYNDMAQYDDEEEMEM